jgi:hypothetical protein
MRRATPEHLVRYHGRLVPKSYREGIKATVDAAPPLSEWQKARLRILLRPDVPDQAASRDRDDGGEPDGETA